jgi:hypothetical protein
MQLIAGFAQTTVPAVRIRRLAVVSAVALGIVYLLATRSQHGSPAIEAALFSGWLLMPIALSLCLVRPRLLLGLLVPSTLVTLGLAALSLNAVQAESAEAPGWLVLTSGVVLGDLLGVWFWFGFAPVPYPLRDPFSFGRSALILIHVTLVVAGMALVALS